MNTSPAPSRDYRVTDPFVGPEEGRGRTALLRYLSSKAAMIRASHTSFPPIVRSERGAWELGWITGMMEPLGNMGRLYQAWRRQRDRWVAAGCPESPKPWELVR